jgi:hypothetical protein
LKFDINDGGTLVTLTSAAISVDPLSTINLFNVWCLAVVTLNLDDQKLTLYLNDQEVASATLTNNGETPMNDTSFGIAVQQNISGQPLSIDDTTVFKGFVDETAISPETFNRICVTLLWNQGYGDFYNP